MPHVPTVAGRTVAISVSESPDISVMGLSDAHLRDAMERLALHLLASGARLAYGGDLRANGFTDLLFDLVSRYRREESEVPIGVSNYLAWPAHVTKEAAELEEISQSLAGTGELVCLAEDGSRLDPSVWSQRELHQPTDEEWTTGLTAMRRAMHGASQARVVLGGRVAGYRGDLPGIAEEALLSLEEEQPLFLLGGFGGCARDIAEALGLVEHRARSYPDWPGLQRFDAFSSSDLGNGLSEEEENATLARTPHIDEAIVLVLRGLRRIRLLKEDRR